MLMMLRKAPSLLYLSKALQQRKTPLRFVSVTSSHAASSISRKVIADATDVAALFTSIDGAPKSLFTELNI